MLGLKKTRWEDLPPNKPVCPKCRKHVWYVSQRIIRRPLTCDNCLSHFLYERDLDNSYALYFRGRFSSREELDERTEDYGKDHA